MNAEDNQFIFWLAVVGFAFVANAIFKLADFAFSRIFGKSHDTTTINGIQRELIRRIVEQHGFVGLHSHRFTVTDGKNDVRVVLTLKRESEEKP